MEIEEIKSWAEQNIHDYNTRQAFLLITEIIYNETEDKVTDIETYWNWFKEKWVECEEVNSKETWVYYRMSVPETPQKWHCCYYVECNFLKILNLFYNAWIKVVFNFKKSLADFSKNCSVRFYPDLKIVRIDNDTNHIIKEFYGFKTQISFNELCKLYLL